MLSWGRVHRFEHTSFLPAYLEDVHLVSPHGTTTLYGQGRSYGDVALTDGGQLLQTRHLKRLISANWSTGLVRAESGMTLDQLLQIAVPKGWFLPVTPGTKYVSLGGAVANDVHGKNHHIMGSFGAHICRLELHRSDGETLILSKDSNSELFEVTISGLGLTGLISWVELQLIPIRSPVMQVENHPYPSLEAYYELSADSADWPYTVAWVDCFASGKALGRGIFTRARHSDKPNALDPHPRKPKLRWPADTPPWMLNYVSMRSFNQLYRLRSGARFKGAQHYNQFFYPLDGIADWNRMYGALGFFQYQVIIPKVSAKAGMRAILKAIADAKQGSFLAVMKNHGPEPSPGRNSFCLEGTSLALDFANRGAPVTRLFKMLDELVLQHGGRLYPAKDGLMSARVYQLGFPRWTDIETLRDPALNSAFWARVTG